MGKGFKKGAGGADLLNFKVVGGTAEPAYPKENWIWVNTDQKITGHYFSATQPGNMAEGEVWISVGTSSPVVFNALKKNGLCVYPISAKQYISGVCVEVTAKSYQGGKWVSWWDGVLYNKGDFVESITGGWQSLSVADNDRIAGTLGKTDNGNSITVWAEYVGDTSSVAGYEVANAIDVTNYNRLSINVISIDGDYGCDFYLAVYAPDMTNWDTGTVAIQEISAIGETILDLSSVSGVVGIGLKVTNRHSATYKKMTFDSVGLSA